MGGDFLFLFIEMKKKKEKKQVTPWHVGRRKPLSCAQPLPRAPPCGRARWGRKHAGRSRWPGAVFLFCGLGILSWPAKFPWSSLAFYYASCLCSGGKRDVFTLKTAKRKRNFVNEINFKSRMCSLGVKSKKVALIPLFIFIF